MILFKKEILSFSLVIVAIFILSGCSFSGKPDGGVYKSTDGGITFQQKNKISEKSNLNQTDIVSMAVDNNNSETIYIGTQRTGLFRTTDGGENWVKDTSNFFNVNNIIIHPKDSKIIYITTSINNRGKIMKTQNGGQEWEEIYTERSDGTSILSLAVNYNYPEIIYCSNSSGGIFKSEDSGQSWSVLLWADSPVKEIILDKINPELIYFGTRNKGVLKSVNGGKDFEEISKSGKVYALLAHPYKEGGIYLSDDKGLHRSEDQGASWETLNTLVKPENLYSQGLSINIKNDQEIFYSSGKTLYKSVNGGKSWMPIQFDFNRTIVSILIVPNNSSVIYLGTVKSSESAGFSLFPNF